MDDAHPHRIHATNGEQLARIAELGDENTALTRRNAALEAAQRAVDSRGVMRRRQIWFLALVACFPLICWAGLRLHLYQQFQRTVTVHIEAALTEVSDIQTARKELRLAEHALSRRIYHVPFVSDAEDAWGQAANHEADVLRFHSRLKSATAVLESYERTQREQVAEARRKARTDGNQWEVQVYVGGVEVYPTMAGENIVFRPLTPTESFDTCSQSDELKHRALAAMRDRLTDAEAFASELELPFGITRYPYRFEMDRLFCGALFMASLALGILAFGEYWLRRLATE